MKYGIILFLAIFFAAGAVFGDTLAFRGGEVLAAELSRQAPTIRNLDEDAFEFNFNTRAYCLVTVKMTPGRTLGTTDYSIEIFGRRYPCVAIRVDGGAFDAAVREFTEISPSRKYGLLFIIDGSVVGADKQENLELAANAPGKYQKTVLPFTNLASRAFTAAGRISDRGMFQAE